MPDPGERTARALERIADALEALVRSDGSSPTGKAVRALAALAARAEDEAAVGQPRRRPRIVR